MRTPGSKEKIFSRGLPSGELFMTACFAIAVLIPASAFAGNYTTSISPSGAEVVSPITATFNIQDFGQRDYGTSCVTGFVPAEAVFNYWFGQGSDFNEISPVVVPTAEQIASGIYTATLNIPVGAQVDSIGAEFFLYAGGGGVKCGFYGNQPNGSSMEPWLTPILTVIAPPTTVIVSGGRGFINNAPSAIFTDFPPENVWHGAKTLSYYAVDHDQVPGGLRNKPIDVYYSDNSGMTWKELTRDGENSGKYVFDSAKLPDGNDYKVKITATDNFGVVAEAISANFSIDNSGPTFKVTLSPQTSIKETDNITLSVSASEDLKQAPEVTIAQKGAEPQTLVVSGARRSFSAAYTVLKGFPGEATISVKGADPTGNTGETVTSGKTFFIGRFGPPPPAIDSITDGQVFSVPSVIVSGRAEEAAEVILVLNGKTEIRVMPDENGQFVFKDIILSEANKGHNVVSISSIDKNGVPSVEAAFTLKLNKSPTISFSTVLSGTLSGKKEIKWLASDPNGDDLSYAVEYSVDGGKNWDIFVSGLIETAYELDTATLFDGADYRLKVTANDGAETVSAVSEKFTIYNGSALSLSGIPASGLITVTSPVFDGTATLAANKIASIKYSFDKEKWENVALADGKADSSRENFAIRFSTPLIDGKYNIVFEVEDERGGRIRAFRTFVIDTMPPIAPIVTYPVSGEAIDAGKDLDPSSGGIQINILGKSEAGAALEIMVNNRRYQTTGTNKGEFIFRNIALFSRGANRYFLSSADVAGNVTKSDGFIISNGPPAVAGIIPKAGGFIGGIAEIGWEAKDPDGDPLLSQIFYRKKGRDWTLLANDLSTTNFKWDASRLDNGEYGLKIVANDGLSDAFAESVPIFIDNTAPQIVIAAEKRIITNNIRTIFDGVASDKLSGVKYVEYSFDGDKWYKALVTEGYESAKAKFEFYWRGPLKDGSYMVRTRATDEAGNLGYSNTVEFVVDTSPPSIGGSMISSGALSLFPEEDGLIHILKDKPYKIALSASADAREVNLNTKDTVLKMDFDRSTALWRGELILPEIGEYPLTVHAKDEIGNSQIRAMPKLKVVDGGHVSNEQGGGPIAGATVAVQTFNAADNSWRIWDGRAFGQENPQTTDKDGRYGFLVPAGKYRLEIASGGFEGVRSQELTVKKNTFININIALAPTKGLIQKIMDYFK